MELASRRPWIVGDGYLEMKVRLTPRSRGDAIEGVSFVGEEPVLKARVGAVPSEGAANRALEKLCATWLGVPKSSVAVWGGLKSRLKTVRVSGDGSGLEKKILDHLGIG